MGVDQVEQGAVATSNTLQRGLIGLLWVVPVIFFSYFTIIDRWPAGEQALAHLGIGPRIVVGVSLQRSLGGSSALSNRQQAYIAVPASFRTLDAYDVIQDGTGVHVHPIRFGLFIFGGLYGAWIAGSIWYLFKRGRG